MAYQVIHTAPELSQRERRRERFCECQTNGEGAGGFCGAEPGRRPSVTTSVGPVREVHAWVAASRWNNVASSAAMPSATNVA